MNQHIPWSNRFSILMFSQLAFRMSDSTLARWLTPGFSLLGENVVLTESCQLPESFPVNLATPLWAWVKSDNQATLTLIPTPAEYQCLATQMQSGKSWYHSLPLHLLFVCFMRFCGEFTDSGHSYKEIPRPVLPSWWVTIPRGLVTVRLLPGYQNPKTLWSSHKW